MIHIESVEKSNFFAKNNVPLLTRVILSSCPKFIYVIHQYLDKVKVGALLPVQQPGSYWERSSALPLVGVYHQNLNILHYITDKHYIHKNVFFVLQCMHFRGMVTYPEFCGSPHYRIYKV